MADDRNRISITITDAERAEIEAVAGVLGIKPTRVVYECVKSGLTGVLDSGQKIKRQIEFAQHLKNQLDWVEGDKADKAKKPKPKTNTQKKFEAKKKKSR